MKRLILATFAVALLGGTLLVAQSGQPLLRPDTLAWLNDPATLINEKDIAKHIDSDGWDRIILKIVWELRDNIMPDRARQRTIDTINSVKTSGYPIIGDTAPAKRALSYMILWLDDRNRARAAEAAAREQRMLALESQVKDDARLIKDDERQLKEVRDQYKKLEERFAALEKRVK